jgi:hypothetical protein
MIAGGEVASGVYGAWLLARRRPEGLNWFDSSLTGYWHSFWAALLVAPAFLVLELITGGFGSAEPRDIAVQAISYVIDWTAFPLLMTFISDTLKRGQNYTRYIVAYNWSAVVQMAILLPAAVMAVLVPSAPTLLLVQGITIVLLVYRAYIAHVALDVNFGTSAGIVLLDVLLSGLVDTIGNRLTGG